MNLFVGLLFVFNVYSWIENLETAGYIIPENIKIPETFVLTIMYDSISRTYDTLTQFWATIAFLLIVLAGFASTVSWSFLTKVLIYKYVEIVCVSTCFNTRKIKFKTWSYRIQYCMFTMLRWFTLKAILTENVHFFYFEVLQKTCKNCNWKGLCSSNLPSIFWGWEIFTVKWNPCISLD